MTDLEFECVVSILRFVFTGICMSIYIFMTFHALIPVQVSVP